jgi:hypothetical protein
MNEERAKETVEKIITEIDKSTLLGAAYDCISDVGKQKFQDKLIKIVIEGSNLERELSCH